MTDYKLRLYNTSGVLQHELVDFHGLTYTKRVNAPGLLRFSLNGDHAAAAALADKWPVEVWRRNKAQAIDWACDFYGLFREPDREGAGPGLFTALCPGQLSMLGWRIVAWKSGMADRSLFTSEKAETIANTLVAYNATSAATTANGRERAGAITGLSVETDGAAGNTLDWPCAFDVLLETLQELASIGGGDFDVVKTAAAAWEWRWYEGQLGTDRTAEVVFAVELGNMANPRFVRKRLGERTVAIVGGQNEGTAREIEIRTGPNYSSSNDIEMFVDARDAKTTAALQARGDQRLDEARAVEDFSFDVLQIPSTLYGKDYFLGDLVTVRSPYTGAAATRKVQAVTVTLGDDGSEQIGVEMIDV